MLTKRDAEKACDDVKTVLRCLKELNASALTEHVATLVLKFIVAVQKELPDGEAMPVPVGTDGNGDTVYVQGDGGSWRDK